MTFKDFKKLNNDIGSRYDYILKRDIDTKNPKDYHYNPKRFFLNEINIYINYINFLLIEKILGNFLDKNLDMLDVGCGFGDKTVILKNIFKNSNIYGIETRHNDDPEHIKYPPCDFFPQFYADLAEKFKVKFLLYDGINLPFGNKYFDIIILYAVIEHIKPSNRVNFITSISKKLKENGYIIITRCPRYYGLMEFMSRKLKLGAHSWIFKKQELLNLFNPDKFEIVFFKRMNNIPNKYSKILNFFSRVLIIFDKILDFIKWPFSTDYFLVIRKKETMIS